MAKIVFKTKPYSIWSGDVQRQAITFKKTLTRSNCDLKPHEHNYYNCDLFPGMLNRAYRKVIGEYKTWAYVDDLPVGVSVDTSKFLAVVTVELPANFK